MSKRIAAAATFRHRAHALGDELETLHQDREPPRLVDEIDRAALERRLLVDVVAEHGQEDHRRGAAGAAQAAQHLEPVHAGHAPVEQDDVGAAAAREIVERRRTRIEADDRETFVDQIEAERLAERVVVINENYPYRSKGRPGRDVR
jgi:hypothetical protein